MHYSQPAAYAVRLALRRRKCENHFTAARKPVKKKSDEHFRVRVGGAHRRLHVLYLPL
jgi:hypothetical protein